MKGGTIADQEPLQTAPPGAQADRGSIAVRRIPLAFCENFAHNNRVMLSPALVDRPSPRPPRRLQGRFWASRGRGQRGLQRDDS